MTNYNITDLIATGYSLDYQVLSVNNVRLPWGAYITLKNITGMPIRIITAITSVYQSKIVYPDGSEKITRSTVEEKSFKDYHITVDDSKRISNYALNERNWTYIAHTSSGKTYDRYNTRVDCSLHTQIDNPIPPQGGGCYFAIFLMGLIPLLTYVLTIL